MTSDGSSELNPAGKPAARMNRAAADGILRVVLPLKGDGCALGVFALASGAPGAFGDNENALLTQLASDLAFGITSLRERAERRQADAQVRQLHEELRRHAEELEQRVAERTRELAVARDRAEAADHLKSAFLATMSHELRTPLNPIIGFTGIVLQGLAGPLNPEQTKQLGMVRVSARHLLELINDVLDISKIEAGQLEVRAEFFDLAASARRVAAVLTPHAPKKGLVLTLTAPAGLPPGRRGIAASRTSTRPISSPRSTILSRQFPEPEETRDW